MAQKDMTTDTLKLVGGGLVGAGLALLLAPQSGKETRRDIVRYARTLGNKSNEVLYEFNSSLAEFIDDIGCKANDILSSSEEMSQEAKQSIITALEKGQQRLEKQKQKLARMIG